MSNIRVDVDYTIKDGTEIKFRSPVDCSQITGLIVYYTGANGNTTSKVFALADAHGSNVGDIDHLFAEDVVVKVILDVTKGMAFVQNADTNAYIERTFIKSVNDCSPDENGHVEINAEDVGAVQTSSLNGSGLGITNIRKFNTFADIPQISGLLHCYVEVKSTPDPDCPYPSDVTMWWDVLQFGLTTRQVQICSQAYSSHTGKGEVWHRSKHDSKWGAWAKLTNASDLSLLTAEDVGARSNTWVPSKSDLTWFNDWFGNGTEIVSGDNLNDFTTIGKYRVENSSTLSGLTNCPVTSGNFTMFVFYRSSSKYLTQMIITASGIIYLRGQTSSGWNAWTRTMGAMESANFPGCYYRTVDGGEEWYNPPMVLGVEYRTTERHEGKVVYTMRKNFGALPNATGKEVYFGTSATTHIRGEVVCTEGNQNRNANGMGQVIDLYFYTGDSYYAKITTNSDASVHTATVQVWYTKD